MPGRSALDCGTRVGDVTVEVRVSGTRRVSVARHAGGVRNPAVATPLPEKKPKIRVNITNYFEYRYFFGVFIVNGRKYDGSHRSSPPDGWLGATNMTQEVLVLGGGATGLAVASELTVRGQTVALVDDAATVDRARETGVTAHESALDTATLAVDRTAATVVVATPCDARNLLLGATAPRAFGADRVVALVNDPTRREAFDAAGIETVCVPQSVARATTDAVVDDAIVANRTTGTGERPDRTTGNEERANPTTDSDERVRLEDR